MNSIRYTHIIFSLVVSGLLLIGLFLLLNGAPHTARAASGELFVSPTGSGTACSQSSPCSLQTALSQAADGNTIYLAGGTYTGAGGAVITVTKTITLYGGWNGAASGPVTRAPDVYTTVLDGEGARRVVYISGPATVTMEGLTIANGSIISTTTTGWNGAGLYARDAALTVRHTRVYSNVIDVYDVAGSHAYGGGMMVEGGSLRVESSTFRWNSAWARIQTSGGGLSISGTLTATVIDTLFQDNDAWNASGLHFLGNAVTDSPFQLLNSTFVDNGRGKGAGRGFGGYAGAIRVEHAQAHIEGNVFRGNQANNDYGAVYVYHSGLALTRNVIAGNLVERTSAIYLLEVSPLTATNNIIADNRSTYYWISSPAVAIRFSNGTLLHNTIARNQNLSGSNVGISYGILADSSTLQMTNTILVSHTVGISVTADSTAMLEGTLWGSGPWANGTDWGGSGTILTGAVNVWGDPAFVGPDGGNYHIGPGSAAINAGVNAGVTTDIDGDPRPVGAGYDIGADEFIYRVNLPLVVRSFP